MQFFIGVVPPDEYKKKIIDFQKRWKNNSITEVVEPHITLKAQGGLTADKGWLTKVEKVCNDSQPFSISLGGPMFFGNDILYLSAAAKELYRLHKVIVREISPSKDLIKKYFELGDFVPHMTLGKTNHGLTRQELIDMAKLAEKDLNPFPDFETSSIRTYQEVEMNKYIKLRDIPLG